MTARVEHQPAYILHRRPYRETSFLVDLLTLDHGKVTVVAKGARRSRRSDAALLQPFQPVQVSWLGRSDLKTLTSIELRPQATGRFELVAQWLFAGFYINELLEVLLVEQDPAPELFALYEDALAALRASAPLEPNLRRFEKRLLEALGVGLCFDQDADSGAAVEPGESYLFLPETGFVRFEANQDRSQNSPLLNSPLVVPGAALLALAAEDFDDRAHLLPIKHIMRRSLDALLQGRRLRSRDLFRQYKETHRA